MRTIAFVIPWFGEKIPGGAEMELRGLVTHLNEAGVKVEVLTTCVKDFNSDWSVNYHKPGMDEVLGVKVRRFKVRKRDAQEFAKVNAKLMKEEEITLEEERIFCEEMVNSSDLCEYITENQGLYELFVFIPYMFGTTYYGCQICPEKSVLIPCLHDESYAYMHCFRSVFSRVAGMIFHAKPEEQLAKAIYNLDSVKTQVLGEGIDTDIQCNANDFKVKFQLNDPFILYAGRKDKGKNVDKLLQYFAEYKKRNKNEMKLVLIGGGEIAIPKEVANEVIDLGFVDKQDKYNACAAATVLCQPSNNESFSLVIMESWLCKRPVLVSGGCAVTKQFAIDTNGGLYFNSYFEFEGAVNYLLKNEDVAMQMGQNGYEYVNSNFAWDVIVGRYMQFFKSI